MAITKINGKKVHYILQEAQTNKEAETLVLIHANAVDLRAFDPLLHYLGDRHHILRYDLRGFGKSDNDQPISALTIGHFIMDLQELLDTLKINSPHIIGWQMGALIGAGFASLYPNKVKSLTIMSMPCHPPHMIESIRSHRKELSGGKREIPFEYLEAMASTLPKGHPELAKLKEYANHIEFDLYAKVMDLTVSADPIKDIKNLHCPTLILSGSKEVLFPPHYLRLHTIHLRHCRLVMIPNASSLIVLDQPKGIAQLINDFISEPVEPPPISDPFIRSVDESMLDYVSQIQSEWLHKLEAHKQLQIDILQQFQVFIEGDQIVNGWNKRFAKPLLAYLTINRSTTRDHICEALWPHSPIQQAKANLRVYLSYLRQLLTIPGSDHSFLVMDGAHVYLQGEVKCDAVAFMEKIQEAQHETSVETKQDLIDQLLNNLPRRLFEPLDIDWFLQLKTQIEEDLIDLVLWNANRYKKQKDYLTAIRHLKKTVLVAPSIDLYECLIDLFGKAGNEEQAIIWHSRMLEYDRK